DPTRAPRHRGSCRAPRSSPRRPRPTSCGSPGPSPPACSGAGRAHPRSRPWLVCSLRAPPTNMGRHFVCPPGHPGARARYAPRRTRPSRSTVHNRSSYYMTASTVDTTAPQIAVNDIGSEEDLLAAIDSTIKDFNDGDIVEGHIVKVDRDEVLLDIGYKTEGVIPSREL